MTDFYQNFSRVIKEHGSFMIATHENPDGDAVGTSFALALALRNMGKNVQVVCREKMPQLFDFLPGKELYIMEKDLTTKKFDVIFVLDASNWRRCGLGPLDSFQHKILINIDHHVSEEPFGDYQLSDPEAVSTASLVYEIFTDLDIRITKEIAENLYTGLITDTGNYKHSNTNESAFRMAAGLCRFDIEPHRITRLMYYSEPVTKKRLYGRAFSRLQSDMNDRLVWTWVTLEDYKETGALAEDTEGIADDLSSVKTMKIGVFFRERHNGGVKVSIRSTPEYDVKTLVEHWNGGGHRQAAGCTITEYSTMEEAIEVVLNKTRELL